MWREALWRQRQLCSARFSLHPGHTQDTHQPRGTRTHTFTHLHPRRPSCTDVCTHTHTHSPVPLQLLSWLPQGGFSFTPTSTGRACLFIQPIRALLLQEGLTEEARSSDDSPVFSCFLVPGAVKRATWGRAAAWREGYHCSSDPTAPLRPPRTRHPLRPSRPPRTQGDRT